MKQFACGTVVPGCTAEFEGTDEAQILEQVAEHARRDHGMTEVPQSVVEQVRENITG
jgi:predicted small metal-binding protein